MKSLKEIKYIIKLLENEILNDVSNREYLSSLGLVFRSNIEDSITARKVLLWVIETKKREKKEDNSRKLSEFKIEKPL